MFDSYFSSGQQLALGTCFASALIAIVLHLRRKTSYAIGLLTACALGLRLFAAALDPYLNEWDEGFHALVAKNMLQDPFTPKLHWNEAMPESMDWMKSQLWLHKPPFFLWQIALALKIFGVHPWAVRVPSAAWLALLVPVTYRIGQLLLNSRVAFIAALFCCFSYYLEELSAAAVCNDHNDAVVIATVACSWWTLLEYWNTRQWKWALLTGLFSACAVLTKWYVGLTVFLPWAVVLLRNKLSVNELFNALGAFGVVLVLAGSWIASIWHRFPEHVSRAIGLDLDHVTDAVEQHTGSWTYHFHVIDELIPPMTWWVMVPAMAWLVLSVKRWEHRALVLVLFIAVHLAFAIAQTKMFSYTMVLFPLYMIAFANGLAGLVDTLIVDRFRTVTIALAMVLLSGLMLDLERLQYRHTVYKPPRTDQCWRQQQLGAMKSMEQLITLIPDPERSVVFNIPPLHHIQFMFNTGIEAWNAPPSTEDASRLKARGYTVYAVQDGLEPSAFPEGVIVVPDEEVKFPDIGRPTY